MLTAASPADPVAFEKWIAEIGEYRRLADVKAKAKARAYAKMQRERV